MNRTTALSALMASVLAASTAAAQQPAKTSDQPKGPATLQVSDKEPLGAYVSDGNGTSLYMFEADSKGETTCYDACAKAWPPLITMGEPVTTEDTDPSLVGTIERKDGAQQVTYGGWPLYYFVKDQEPGDTAGQDVKGFGAEWYLVSPNGEKVHAGG